jgi:hypothetical protein
MIQERLDKIEERLKLSETIKENDKTELLNLLNTLKTEIADLSRTDKEHAESIAQLAELSTHEATRNTRSDALFDLSIEGLVTSGRGFEISHPKLVAVINAFCNYLTDMGI